MKRRVRCTVDMDLSPASKDDMKALAQSAAHTLGRAIASGWFPEHGLTVNNVGTPSVKPTYQVLKEPLTPAEIRKQYDATGRVTGVVPVTLEELIDLDEEGTLDLLSELLTESSLLCDISYEAVGFANGDIHVTVNGDPNLILEADGDAE